MLTVPQGYRDAMDARNPVHVKMDFGDGIILTDDDIDSSTGITLTDAFNPDTDMKMGVISSRQLSTKIIINDKTRYMHWTNQFELSFGVEDGEGGTIWVYFGKFKGNRPRNTTTLNSVDFTAYDEVMAFDADANDWLDTFTSSKKLDEILSEISTLVGIDIVTTGAIQYELTTRNRTNRFTNESYTYRDIISAYAEAVAVYGRIGGSDMDKLELVWFDKTSNPRIVTRDEIFYEEHADLYDGMFWNDFDQLTWNEADQMTWNEVTGYYKDTDVFDGIYIPKIDGGIICRYPNNQKTGHIYRFENNPVPKTTSSNKVSMQTECLTPMLARLNFIGGILPLKVECVGDLVTQAGDVIHVELPEETIEMPIYYKTMHWNGYVTDTYETTAPDAL